MHNVKDQVALIAIRLVTIIIIVFIYLITSPLYGPYMSVTILLQSLINGHI